MLKIPLGRRENTRNPDPKVTEGKRFERCGGEEGMLFWPIGSLILKKAS